MHLQLLRTKEDAYIETAMASFKKLVIVRNPFTRLLSGYLDRIVKEGEWGRLYPCHRHIGEGSAAGVHGAAGGSPTEDEVSAGGEAL
jgi:hypothetical protein